MHDKIERAYSRPMAFLPATSDVPRSYAHSSGFNRVDLDVIRSRLGTVRHEATELYNLLEHHIISPTELGTRITQLSKAIYYAHSLLDIELQPFYQTSGTETSPQAADVAAQDQSPDMARCCAVYDRYFNVIRVTPMTTGQYAAQVSKTCLDVLQDLQFTILEREEVTKIINAVSLLFGALVSASSSEDGSDAAIDSEPIQIDTQLPFDIEYEEAWRESIHGRDEWTREIAFYRWVAGHHFFNLCTISCRDALMQAQSAIIRGDQQESARMLGVAQAFLRGTTAAMWYAGNFAAAIYNNIVRPSMILPDAPAGFSGDHNADYNRMKVAKNQLKETLFTSYGRDVADWPAELYESLISFHETDIEDNEHHILIAASKVGKGASLAQEEWQKELPPEARTMTGVDVLRDMAEQKRGEFAL